MKKTPTSSRKGFTLIELLVAMVITTIIVSILVSVTALALDTWNRSRSEIRAARQAKAMIDSMAADFESMVVREGNPFEWLLARSNPDADGPNANASPNSVDLIFFSAATDRYNGQVGVDGVDLGGDVSTIGYQLVYKDPIGSSDEEKFKTFVLYRKLVNPDETFNLPILGQESLDGKVDFGTSGTDVVSDERNFICENVYQFTLTFHVQVVAEISGVKRTLTIPVSIGQGASSQTDEFAIMGTGIETDFSGTATVDNAQLQSGTVSAVEVSLTVLTDFGIRQMQSRSLSGEDLEEFIAQNSYQYSKLISVPGS
ncbi:MAG: type II secretion system protein J [Akkermansiaceae bacterium]